MPLGELLYEGRGKMTVNRIIDGGDGIAVPKIELTLQGTGYYKKVEVFEIWTMVAVIKNDGSSFGDGQGLIFTKDPINREIATASIRGVGGIVEMVEDPETGELIEPEIKKFKNHSVIFYNVKNLSSRGQLNFLHNRVGMNEFETNEETLEYTNKVWEWK